MRKLLEGIFRDEGDFDVQLARNGAEALDLVRSFDPHVVTLDVQMPGMDGLSCLSQIMIQAPRPVVMVSSLTAEGAEQRWRPSSSARSISSPNPAARFRWKSIACVLFWSRRCGVP